jgi:ABC-2 type transport system permease protein
MTSTAALAVRQFRYEQKVFRRNPAAMFFVVVFPALLLVIFGSLNSGEHVSLLGGLRFTQYYTPAIAAFGLMSACYANLSARFVSRRETGALKRVRGTPLPLIALVAAFIINAVVVGVVVGAINIGIGVAFYHVTLPNHWTAYLLVGAVGATSFCSLGVALANFIPNLDAAEPIIWGTFMPLVFISGTFFPIRSTALLARVASMFPMQHLVQASFAAFDTRQHGSGIAWGHLGVLAAWAMVGLLLALLRFRWEPHRA